MAVDRLLDNEIRRINKQISETARIFGFDSSQYQRYENLILSSKTFDKNTNLFRLEEGKPIQLKRSKLALNAFKNISQYSKAVEKLSKEKTVGEQKKKFFEKYKEENKDRKITRKELESKFKEAVRAASAINALIEKYLSKLYDFEEKLGYETELHQKIREISRGSWTSPEEKDEMIRRLNEGIDQLEQQERIGGEITPNIFDISNFI